MFRTKHSVDRHVQELFRKVKDDNERTLRCYNIAKLYYQVQDYESARRYVSCYLEMKGDQAGPHKLLGEIYEALGQKESALAQYKQSLEIESRQDDLVLKVCELLADMDVALDINRVKYWVDRADAIFPHHPTVFQLKEKILTADRPNNGSEDLEALIAAELSARPSDVQLRVKLLKYYIDKSRLDDAYKHALEVESTHAHRDSVAWYEALCDLLTKCKEVRQQKWTFWILYVSSLERYATLSLKEQGHVLKKTVSEAAQAVFNFDQALTEAKLQNFPNTATFADHMFNHMWGQLHYHLACLLLRKTKREQGSWSDAGRLCAPLLLTAMHVAPFDTTAPWALNIKDPTKAQIQLWRREGSYRCSQAGHVLQEYARDDTKKLMDKIDKFCIGSWRERIYQRIFVSKAHISTSYFANHAAPNPPLRLCSATELKLYDQVAEEVWPASLHHHVWLGILNRPRSKRSNNYDDSGPRPHQYCHVFPDLQISVFNLSQAAPDSLGQLDIDAFLNAAVLCASMVIEEHQRSGFLSPDRLPTLPADITNTLCTSTQEKWWASAYKIYLKQDGISGDLGEIRQDLQRGLEVVRCIGNHGLHPAILVHLARIFHHRAKLLKEKDKNHTDLPFVEARCELYWSAVVPLLERLLNNQAIRTTSTKMFDYQGKEMNNIELTNALEEGKLLLAQRYIRDKQHEQAIEALQALKCPEASFMQGEIYKSLADELVSTVPKESLTSAIRSQHVTTLSKARGCYYLTLDRLRSPGMNPKHPLNSELGSRITDIENDLRRIDPDLWRANRNDCDAMSEESFSSAHSGDQPVNQNSFTGLGSTMLGTSQRNTHRAQKQASTPCRIPHQDMLEFTRKSVQQEARPSPERLDAQIRQLVYSKDNLLQTILEQNKTLLEANKSLVETTKSINEKIEDLQKQFAELRKDNQIKHQHQQQQQQQRARSVSVSRNNLEDDLYLLGDDDYTDLNYSAAPPPVAAPPQIPQNLFGQQQGHGCRPFTPMVYPQPGTFQGYYGGAIPFTEPHAQHIPTLYPPGVFQIPALYPRPPMDPSLGGMPKIAENIQGMFTSRLLNQLTDLAPQQQQQQQQLQQHQHQQQHQQQQQQQQSSMQTPFQHAQLSMQLQHFDMTRNEIPAKDVPVQSVPIVKDQPVNRAPPVNVVITTSDTLPTSAPTVQPTLSVTIPAQYRAGVASNVATTTAASTAPHSYQISMPSHATIPTTVNLPPLSTTITNTISATVAEQERIVCKNGSVLSTSIQNYSSESAELEHDPLPDFVPVIPLPAEVKVTTGEEDETSLFCARAKLYRWSDKEWKERGIGNVKLLRNDEGKVRLVMRREQVLKICANHMITPDMELTAMMNNERAWIWVANDFADEELKLEKLCIKFKYAEEARAFKESFDKARASVPLSPAKPFVVKVTERDKNATKNDSVMVGGFSFSSTPVIQKPVSPEPSKTTKIEETPKPSPFAGFSFTKTTSSDSPSQTSGFSFIKSPTFAVAKPAQNVSTSDQSSAQRSTLRRPHAPAPAELAALPNESKTTEVITEIVATLNDDGEHVVYEKKANLSRCSDDRTQWKSRGSGVVKIIVEPKSEKVRLFIRRDENNKVFHNEQLLASTKFTTLVGTDNVVTWWSHGRSTGKIENIAVHFETLSQAAEFIDRVVSLQRSLIGDRLPISSSTAKSKGVRQVKLIVKKSSSSSSNAPLADMFKPATGSWECPMCYTRNDSSAKKCAACEAEPAVGTKADGKFESTNEKSSLWTQFKPQAESWECQSCYIRNTKENCYCVACDTAKDPTMPPKPKTGGFDVNTNSSSQTGGFTFGMPTTPASTPQQGSRSEMFKPQTGSWECQGCLLRNSESSNHCAACEAPKDPSIPAKSKVAGFNTSVSASLSTPTFSFGIPRATIKDTSTSGFSFKMPSADENKAAGDTGNTLTIFGTSAKQTTQPSTDFVFGVPQRPGTPSNTQGGRGDVSEDEVAESEDVYFAPVVPLPDKVEVKTGEEDEEIVYTHRAKLFRFDSVAKEWKERGLGDVKLLRHNVTKKLRMVMRRDQTLKLCLNHVVNADLELKPKDDKTWLWNAADYSEGDIEHLQLACRFKTPEIAADFKRSVDDALNKARSIVDESASRNEETLTKSPSLQDIQVVYEVTVSEDEKAAALKLRLPENFYAYKQKDDCPGCLGCREPDVPLFDEANSKRANDVTNSSPSTESMKEKSNVDKAKSASSPITPKIAPAKLTSPTIGSKPEETSATPTTTSLVFAGGFIQKPTMSFTPSSTTFATPGTIDDSSKIEKKPTSFVFGTPLTQNQDSKVNVFSPTLKSQQIAKSSPFNSSTFTAENLSICSPSNATNQESTNFGAGSTQSPFDSSSLRNSGRSAIFGGPPSSGTFGGTVAGKFQSENTDGDSASTLSSPLQNTFGGPAKTTNPIGSGATTMVFGGLGQPSFDGQAFRSSTATTAPVFGQSAVNPTTPSFESVATGTNIFGGGSNTSSSKLSFGGLVAAGNNAASPASNDNPTDASAVGKTSEIRSSANFLPVDNTVTFSNLAAQSPEQPSFAKDPNFSFAGAGATVFGAKTTPSAAVQNSKSAAAVTPKKSAGDEEAEEDNEEDTGQEYDPHFEPIIPLPDTIEVRTGEEEEEKVFCHRAKLYRYESETKEWKERGTGEMKLLYHAERARYRLLLRREQVHKVVCNLLVTPDLELRALHSSDRAWMWAGINHAEEPYAVEELAVKFKNPELAVQFKEAVEKAKAEIRDGQSSGQVPTNESDLTECYGEDQEDEADEDEDDEEVEEPSIMFVGRADLMTFQGSVWKSIGVGLLKILYDSEIYGAKIILEVEQTGEIVSNTVITMETTMERNENSCVWTAIDEIPNPPIRRSLKAVFASAQLAQEMYINFQDGQEYAKQADISEAAYYDPTIGIN